MAKAIPESAYDYTNELWFQRETPSVTSVPLATIQEMYHVDVLLVVATPIERKAALKTLEPLPQKDTVSKVAVGMDTYYVGSCGACITALVMCEKGSVAPDSSQATATAAIQLWNPIAMIMPGICFARDQKKQKPADLIVANKIIPYENLRAGTHVNIPRGPQPQPGLTLLNRFKNVDGWQFLRPDGEAVSVTSGPMLSGEKLVDDPKFKKELFNRHPDAIAGEMEGPGIWAAATRARIEWILVKAVVDWADGKKHSDFQPMAAAAACSLVKAVLTDPNALHGLEPSKHRKVSSGSIVTTNRLERLERTSRERCASRWEALRVPAALANELALDDAVGTLPNELHAAVGGIKVVLAPMGTGKTLAAERLFQRAAHRALESDDSPLPVFVDCNRLDGQSLEAAVRERLSELGDPEERGVDLVVDELDRLSQQLAIDTLSQARVISRTWNNSRVHLFSRLRQYPLSNAEKSWLPELSKHASLTLIAMMSEEDRLPILQAYPEVLRKSVVRPLFAILLGVYRRTQNNIVPASQADLFVALSETAIHNTGRPDEAVHETLRKLARHNLTTGKDLILKRDMPLSGAEVDAIQVTGFVEIDGNGTGWRFALPVLAEWYAAQAIIRNEVSIATLAKSQSRLERWKHALAIALGTTSFDIAVELMRPVASAMPASAAMIVDDAVANWGRDENVDAPPADVCAEQLRTAMELWMSGLGPLADCMSASNGEGGLREIKAATNGPWLTAAWHSSEGARDEAAVVSAVERSSQFISSTWGGSKSARPGNSSTWALRWTHEECVADIEPMLKGRMFKTKNGPLHAEAVWKRMLDCARKFALTRNVDELNIASIRDKLASFSSLGSDAYLRIGQQAVNAQELVNETDRLLADGITTLRSPWPRLDESQAFHPWPSSGYSSQQLLNRISQVYLAAMSEYCAVVETYFPKFAPRLWTYAMIPARFVARVEEGDQPWMEWHLWPLPADSDSTTEVQTKVAVESTECDDICSKILVEIAAVRGERAQWWSARASHKLLDDFGQTPVTDLVYEWLRKDLSNVNWASVT